MNNISAGTKTLLSILFIVVGLSIGTMIYFSFNDSNYNKNINSVVTGNLDNNNFNGFWFRYKENEWNTKHKK